LASSGTARRGTPPAEQPAWRPLPGRDGRRLHLGLSPRSRSTPWP
jgi:hypothetical protein